MSVSDVGLVCYPFYKQAGGIEMDSVRRRRDS
jgi:hypothetical protein